MDAVKFERLISYRPVLDFQTRFEEPTLRDMVFDYYVGMYKNSETANDKTKEYLDNVYKRFVKAT